MVSTEVIVMKKEVGTGLFSIKSAAWWQIWKEEEGGREVEEMNVKQITLGYLQILNRLKQSFWYLHKTQIGGNQRKMEKKERKKKKKYISQGEVVVVAQGGVTAGIWN